MIFNGIKRRWMRKQVAEKSKQDRKKVIWPQSMVVVCEMNQKGTINIFKKWAQELEIDLDKVTVLCLVQNSKKDLIDGVVTFDRKAIKWSGGFNSAQYQKTLEQAVDLQINYYENSNELLEFTSDYMRSRLKVGYGTEEDSPHDLLINVDQNDHQLFISELKKYLSILTQ